VDGGGEVFRALADPTRRAILDSLFGRDGQTLNELCDKFPEMTRFGVMKHLSVLSEANLVVATRQGRTKRHYLNPAPVEQVASRWISKYAARFTSRTCCAGRAGGAVQEIPLKGWAWILNA
jgi:DNA-binding transcriptional ArsR family regulator